MEVSRASYFVPWLTRQPPWKQLGATSDSGHLKSEYSSAHAPASSRTDHELRHVPSSMHTDVPDGQGAASIKAPSEWASLASAESPASTIVAWRPRLEPPSPPGARASVTFVAVLVATVYAWSGIAKLRVEWLDGSALLALAEDGFLTPLVTPLLRDASVRLMVAWGAAMVELGLAASLLLRATRRPALVVAVSMHFAFEVAVRPDVMGWVMAALLLALATRPRDQNDAVRSKNVASPRRFWELGRRVR